MLASLFVVTGLATTGNPEPVFKPRDRLAMVLILLSTVPYFVRRPAPLPVALVAMTATATLYVLDYDAGGLPFVVAAGAYAGPTRRAAYRPLRDVAFAAAYMYGTFVVMLVSDNRGFGAAEFTTSVPLFGAACSPAGRCSPVGCGTTRWNAKPPFRDVS